MLSWLLLSSGALGAAASSDGPVNNNARVEFKVKFKPKGNVNNFLGDNQYVKYVTKSAVENLIVEKNIDTSLYPTDKVKVKWDHGAVDGDYYVAYVYYQFKYGYADEAEAFYNAVSQFDYDAGAEATAAVGSVYSYIRGKFDPGYKYNLDSTSCVSPDYIHYQKDSVICQGATSCLEVDVSSCTDAASCDDCNNVENCNATVRANEDGECEVDVDSLSDAYRCRAVAGTYWSSDTPMACSGKVNTAYESAYVCNHLDINYCWGYNETCASCEDLHYYKSSNPWTSCEFTHEDRTNGQCLTGFCRNLNCYVKKVSVELTNIAEPYLMKTGHWITVVYIGFAFLTILATIVFKPPNLSSTQLSEHISSQK